jgi:hypothetical protein
MTSPAGTLTRDSAYEINGVTASTPQVVWARREPWTARLVFQTETCSMMDPTGEVPPDLRHVIPKSIRYGVHVPHPGVDQWA